MRTRGFSLAEQLTVAGLVLLLLGVVAQVLIPCLDIWRRDQDRARLEQGARTVGARLAAEIPRSTAASLTILSDPPALSYCLPEGFDPLAGRPLWARMVAWYLDAPNRVLYRKEWPDPLPIPALGATLPALAPARLSEAELRELCTTANGTEKVAAEHVVAFLPSASEVELRLANGTTTTMRRLALAPRN